MAACMLTVLLLAAGCAQTEPRSEAQVRLLTYTESSRGDAQAHALTVDLKTGELHMEEEPLYELRVKTDTGWWSEVYPVMGFSEKLLVLKTEPIPQPKLPYTVIKHDVYDIVDDQEKIVCKELYYEDYKLEYDGRQNTAVIKKGEEPVGTIADFAGENLPTEPIAFFVNHAGKAVLLCETVRTNAEGGNEWYPYTIVAAKTADDAERLQIETIHEFQDIYSRELSMLMPPYTSPDGSNVFGSRETDRFLWNEGCSLVEIDPYAGSFRVILNKAQIQKDMPDFDVRTEGCDFFTGVGCQNGIYIAVFPNYNEEPGSVAAFYDGGRYLGKIVCTNTGITFFDRSHQEAGHIQQALRGELLYAPVF